MKKIMKPLLMLLCSIGISLSVWAQDVISFTWKGSDNLKSFEIATTKNKTFTIDWGDGNVEEQISETGAPTTYVHVYEDTNDYKVTITGTKDCFLSRLNVSDSGNLSALDVSGATALTVLRCNGNGLATLDVSKNVALTTLHCTTNQLTALDLSKNTALMYLGCGINQLTDLDVSNNINLKDMSCSENQLMTLDVSGATALTYLDCTHNDLRTLDVSNNTALVELRCTSNQLTTLNISGATALAHLSCAGNKLTTLDISEIQDQISLFCALNSLSLKELYTLSQQIADINNKILGAQVIPSKDIALNTPTVIDNAFDGKGTSFRVTKSGENAVEGVDYSISGGEITFLTDGKYWVKASNPAIISYPSDPASVGASFVAGMVSLVDPASNGLSLYPNPTSGLLRIDGFDADIRIIRVFDMAGKLLQTIENSGNTQVDIDLSSFADGVYFININGKTIKAVKQ